MPISMLDIKARAKVDEKVYGISLLEQWLIGGNLIEY